MTGRHVPPTHSPLRARALAAGMRSALGAGDARARVDAQIRHEWSARDAETTSSGTVALALALAADGAEHPGAPVALPAYGCYDLATAADAAARRVVLYDLDPATLSPEPASLLRALEAEPSSVVVAHLFGLPVDVDAVAGILSHTGALLVEDAAQGAGARVRGRLAGALAPVSVLSFGRGKGMTGGGGGALLAHDAHGEAVVRRARRRLPGARDGWEELARATLQWALARPALYGIPAALPFLRLGETIYRDPEPPEPLPYAAAGVLAAAWEGARQERGVRVRNARRLIARAVAAGEQVPTVPPGCEPGWLRLPLVSGEGRRRAESEDARRLGIIGGYPRLLSDLPGFTLRCLNAAESFPGARMLAESLYTLPTHGLLSDRDLERLERWLGREEAERSSDPWGEVETEEEMAAMQGGEEP